MISGVVRYEMETAVLEQARADMPISSECTADSETEYACTVTFGGQDVHSTIRIEDVSDFQVNLGEIDQIDTSTISYEVLEQETVVTAQAAQAEMLKAAEQAAERGSPVVDPRCDEDLPEVQVVPDGEEADGHCYAKPTGWRAWPNWTGKYSISGNTVAPIITSL